MVMGNVSGRKKKSVELDQEEYYMEYGQAQVSSSSYRAHMLHPPHPPQHHSPRDAQFPMVFTPQVPIAPPQTTNQIMQIQRAEFNDISTQNRSKIQENRMLTLISWIHGGTRVFIEGSWDNWKTRELLEGSGSDFSIVKVLNAGVYHYRFVVDGQWTYAPDLPHECDNIGNIFNVLDLKENYPENPKMDQEHEYPSSPTSSYDNATFTLQDFSEKLPELPPLLQQMPLNQPLNRQEALQKPLAANLNHLYIKRDGSSQATVALSSSQRFRSKFVTTVLYKPLKKVRK